MALNGKRPEHDLFRALAPGIDLERSEGQAMPTMTGHFAVFDEWCEVDNIVEGHFLERVAPGAFKKTIAENRDRIKVIFDHGRDQQIGRKVLGAVKRLEEEKVGPAYAVGLLDTSYNRDLLPGLEAGLYGSSYRATLLNHEYDPRPGKSAHNPMGLPELVITEAKLKEFGPTPFPTNSNATSVMRSLTPEFVDPETNSGRSSISLSGLKQEWRDGDGGARQYERATEYIGETVWAIHPSALATILQIVGERRDNGRPTAEEIQERIGVSETKTKPDVETASSVAILSLEGTIIPKASLFGDVSGATSVQDFQSQFREALSSSEVAAILIDVDSPGGSSDLVAELAMEILDARGTKPIVAVANTWAASGAYWIASAADEIVVTPSGEVGSIGVYTAHEDISAAQDKLGVKTTLISAGKYKTEGSPYEPLSEDAQSYMQEKVDATYEMFLSAVANGRGVSIEKVREKFGQGRMVMAPKAVKLGMADRVATFDQTLKKLQKLVVKRSADPVGVVRSEVAELPNERAAALDDREPERQATTPLKDEPQHSAEDVPKEREEEPTWLLR